MDGEDRQYSIQELVQIAGVPRRTVRYYVQRELLEPPEGAGRGHYYRQDHLERLLLIRDLQDRGLTLEEIRARLGAGERSARLEQGGPAELPPMELLTRIRLGHGLELLVESGASPPTPSQLRALAAAAARILRREDEEG